jgi:hypothetical protein
MAHAVSRRRKVRKLQRRKGCAAGSLSPTDSADEAVARSDAPFGSGANSGVDHIERSPVRSGEDLLGNTYLATASPNSVSALTGGEIRRS